MLGTKDVEQSRVAKTLFGALKPEQYIIKWFDKRTKTGSISWKFGKLKFVACLG